MKHFYILKFAFLTALLFFGIYGVLGQAPSLEAVQCNINEDYEDITDLVPSMFVFSYDGGAGDIGDGGSDMYDGGNRLNTDIETNIDYSDDVITTTTGVGPTGRYFTRHLDGLFFFAGDLDGVTNFYISGNNGADGGGSVDEHVFTTTFDGVDYDVFVKRVYGAGDPSINHMFIVESDAAISHTWATSTDNDQHDLLGLSGSTRLYYLLYASASGGFIDNATTESIANEVLSIVTVPLATIEANASSVSLCEGETLTLYGTGLSTPADYTWNLAVTDSVEFIPTIGTYSYIIDDATGSSCIETDTVEVVVNAQPTGTLATSDELAAGTGAVYLTLTAGAFPMTFDWDNDGTGDFDDDQNLIGVSAGTYTVTVMAAGGCTFTESATVGSQLSTDELSLNYSVYPNPVLDITTLQLEGEFTFILYDMLGKVVVQNTAFNQTNIDLSSFESGTYLLSVEQNGVVNTVKLMKK
ncbi:MAG: T9SS type A sorting domain-containing protein [Crocinitomicaceae bacterium]|nr:T9SS type A sorting domain-containing protein [Crocinitomicaceae bacterium]